MNQCSCGETTPSKLRPYGKNGAPICFDCAQKPENYPEARRRMEAACDAALASARGAGVALFTDGPPVALLDLPDDREPHALVAPPAYGES